MNKVVLVGGAATLVLGIVALLVVGAAPNSPNLASDHVGRFFTWDEMARSQIALQLGIDNTPPLVARDTLARLVHYILDPLRAALGTQVTVTSGGSRTSQHMLGETADIMVGGLTAVELTRTIIVLRVPFDQVTWYAPERCGHVHVSLTVRRLNRGQVLFAPASGGDSAWPCRGRS